MPYEWVSRIEGAPERSGAPLPSQEEAVLHLWPYRSLPRRGFVWVIGGMSAFLMLPLVEVLGTPVLWGLLPFAVLTGGGLWWALGRSYRDGETIEELRLSRDTIRLVRHNPGGPRQEWRANPYWVTLTLHPSAGPVPDYLTLKGAGREVELGAFLAPEERVRLRDELTEALARVRTG
ncbi:DUF2244 domain-containing protein [Acidimangrovimonas sediminis]|uniref:DUF2244 domain-containing protein n=1 Tax=Acidimangrovimonas sediminis TaxID=2056283 RepID=UPI000C802597|nr:DUF2244 domain-containing protein [Acidimangrovimonas sediminis]